MKIIIKLIAFMIVAKWFMVECMSRVHTKIIDRRLKKVEFTPIEDKVQKEISEILSKSNRPKKYSEMAFKQACEASKKHDEYLLERSFREASGAVANLALGQIQQNLAAQQSAQLAQAQRNAMQLEYNKQAVAAQRDIFEQNCLNRQAAAGNIKSANTQGLMQGLFSGSI